VREKKKKKKKERRRDKATRQTDRQTDTQMELNVPSNRKTGSSDQTTASSSPLFSFGVITDIQYGDLNDGRSFHGNSRFYRDALDKVCFFSLEGHLEETLVDADV